MTDLPSASYVPDRSIKAKVTRRLTQWRVAKPIAATPEKPLVCFTFDDFPKSAATNGAKVLEDAGVRGTFYLCTGLMGQTNATGEICTEEDVHRLIKDGHEIGAHSHTHLDCAKAEVTDALADIEKGVKIIEGILGERPTQLAYPYGETRISLKQKLSRRFDAVRGILPGTNQEGGDLMQLRSFELDANPANITSAANAISSAKDSPGWITLFTHDVATDHSPFGTSPDTLRHLVKLAQDIDADICTMSEAYRRISGIS